MGFLSAMKGANNSWGTATGEFGVGYFGPKNLVDNRSHEMMISGSGLKQSVVFTKADVASAKLMAATSEWVKFELVLKTGFRAIVTLIAVEAGKSGKQMTMSLANVEWWLNGILYQ